MASFEINPRDVLFFRDARPMGGSDSGHGANWPRPDQVHTAIHHAFLRLWPESEENQSWLGTKHQYRSKDAAIEVNGKKHWDNNSHSSLALRGI